MLIDIELLCCFEVGIGLILYLDEITRIDTLNERQTDVRLICQLADH